MLLFLGFLDRDPYWCRPWPSALALAKLLLNRPDLVHRKKVCEIGAGLGIGSIAAVKSGQSFHFKPFNFLI